jgi:DNA-binding beta-propeller fold protein YncE
MAAAMLAGCGGSPPTAIPQGASSVVQVGRSQSPFDSLKKVTSGYLYVSNYQYDEIVLYSYDPKTMTLTAIGQISPQSIRTPLGSCSDAGGNVYVVGTAGTGDTGAIVELAFGTVTVMQTLSDNTGPPSGCSVDPTTGNLAVTNSSSYYTSSYHLAQVLIYKNGEGVPISGGDG